MNYQDITTRKQRVIRLIWTLSILLLGLALSGWLSPIGAQVTLCGEDISRDDGYYRLRGHLTCSTDDPILKIKQANAEFDLRGFTVTGNTENTGIRIEADNVIIVGGTFWKCETALRIKDANGCDIENFKAIHSSGRAIRIQGNGNDIVKSLCLKAGRACFEVEGDNNYLKRLKAIDSSEESIKVEGDNNTLSLCMSLRSGMDGFELRGDGPKGNTAEWCTAIKSGTIESGKGIQFRGPGYAYKCSVFGSSGEGFQIQDGVSGATIERCLVIYNAQDGIEIEAGATGNSIKRNIVFLNGDGITFFDLFDGNDACDNNKWKRNKFRTRNLDCIE